MIDLDLLVDAIVGYDNPCSTLVMYFGTNYDIADVSDSKYGQKFCVINF